jgi:hypothetical protein
VKHRVTFLGNAAPSKPTLGKVGLKHNDSKTLFSSLLLLTAWYKAFLVCPIFRDVGLSTFSLADW